jgi:hypothetical protein
VYRGSTALYFFVILIMAGWANLKEHNFLNFFVLFISSSFKNKLEAQTDITHKEKKQKRNQLD